MHHRVFNVALTVLLVFGICRPLYSESLPSVRFSGETCVLKHWLVAGPFRVSADNLQTWEFDALKNIGLHEGMNAVPELLVRETHPGLFTKVDSEVIDFNHVFGLPYGKATTDPASAYAVCEVEANEPIDAYILLGTSGGAKLWLNGASVFNQQEPRQVVKYDDAVRVRFRKGSNLLLLKVCRFGLRPPWGATVRIESDAERAARSSLELQSRLESILLEKAVIEVGDPLVFAPRGVPLDLSVAYSIAKFDGEIIHEGNARVGQNLFSSKEISEKGLFTVRVSADGMVFEEHFFIGEVNEWTNELLTKSTGRKDRDDFEALRTRLSILSLPENQIAPKSGPAYSIWARKFVYTLTELQTAMSRDYRSGQRPFTWPGLHFRSFRSSIDSALQHYRIYVPTIVDNARPLPLAIMLPTTISASKPFLSSAFVAAHGEAEEIASIAERLGIIVVWCGYRNQPGGLPCELTHLDEVIADIESHYNIDNNRVSLLGACSAGATATIAAVHWPERFAGIGLLSPVFGVEKMVTSNATAAFARYPEFQEWVTNRSALESCLGLSKIPYYIVHDGAEPGHGDLAVAEAFAVAARGMGLRVTLRNIAQSTAHHFGAWEELLEWLSLQERPNVNRVTSTDGIYHNTVSSALASRFVVVYGSGGTTKQVERIGTIIEEFRQAWRQTHFGDCMVVKDSDFVRNEYKDYNIVLIGNAGTNVAWKLFSEDCHVELNRWSARIGKKEVSLPDLGIIAVLDEPSQHRKIVFIGEADLETAVLPRLNLTVDGWFTYGMFRKIGEQTETVAAGRWTQ